MPASPTENFKYEKNKDLLGNDEYGIRITKYIGNDENVIIPRNATYIGQAAFKDCTRLSAVTLSKNTVIIRNIAFDGCTALKNIEFPDKLEEIGFKAFSNCGLQSIVVPEGITVIDEGAFMDCTNLKEVTLPSKITGLGGYLIIRKVHLKTVQCYQ